MVVDIDIRIIAENLNSFFIFIKPMSIIFDLQKSCKAAKEKVWIHYRPSIFQHVGTCSSLKGKVQKLKVCIFVKCHITIIMIIKARVAKLSLTPTS